MTEQKKNESSEKILDLIKEKAKKEANEEAKESKEKQQEKKAEPQFSQASLQALGGFSLLLQRLDAIEKTLELMAQKIAEEEYYLVAYTNVMAMLIALIKRLYEELDISPEEALQYFDEAYASGTEVLGIEVGEPKQDGPPDVSYKKKLTAEERYAAEGAEVFIPLNKDEN